MALVSHAFTLFARCSDNREWQILWWCLGKKRWRKRV